MTEHLLCKHEVSSAPSLSTKKKEKRKRGKRKRRIDEVLCPLAFLMFISLFPCFLILGTLQAKTRQ
jgi:hypothetical protein